jgi:hypothetical protein
MPVNGETGRRITPWEQFRRLATDAYQEIDGMVRRTQDLAVIFAARYKFNCPGIDTTL